MPSPCQPMASAPVPTRAATIRWAAVAKSCTSGFFRPANFSRLYLGGRGGGRGRDHEGKGGWGASPPSQVPVFVLTHHPRPPLEMEGGTVFHFVTDGFESALMQARAAAGDRDVRIRGGRPPGPAVSCNRAHRRDAHRDLTRPPRSWRASLCWRRLARTRLSS